MSILSKLSKRKEAAEEMVKDNMENFMTIIRVYYQSVIALNLGITNIRFLPDLAVYKRVFKVPTQNGKLGQAEKSHSRKLLMQEYNLSESFFKEIDNSIKKNCKNQNEIQSFLIMFQGMTNDLLMLTSNQMKWKFGIPKIFKKILYNQTAKTVNTILTKTNWKSENAAPVARNIRHYKEKLGYTQEWLTEYVFTIIMVVKEKKKRKQEV